MTQDKELLLKDLCARLPYGVCYEHFTWDDECGEDCVAAQIYSINPDGYVKNCYDDETVYIDDVRPYLFPLSSMTEEQKEELKNEISKQTDILIERMKNDDCGIDCGKYHFHSLLELEWLLKNHFDYRGLIERGLAIDATGLNIY